MCLPGRYIYDNDGLLSIAPEVDGIVRWLKGYVHIYGIYFQSVVRNSLFVRFRVHPVVISPAQELSLKPVLLVYSQYYRCNYLLYIAIL